MKKRKLILTLLLVIGLVSITLGVSIAFFNYTRTGSNNTVATGRIYFNTTQDGNISLTNIFPVDSEDIDNVLETGNNVTINIEGDTTYNYGVEYLVTAEDVNIEVNNKKIPVNLYVTSTSNLGNNDDSYFENRGGNTSLYKVLSGGVVHEGQYLLVGYIAKGQEGIEGSLNIKAYIDKDKIAISDTYDGTESDNMGTTTNWVNGRTVFTTEEWNSLSTSGSVLSFKIRVEANEGVWVDPYTTPNLMNTIGINRNAVNIKEIRFIEETPLRMQRRYDASVGEEIQGTKADLTYQETGKVLAWIEPISVSPTGTSNELLNVKPKFLFNEQEENKVEQIDNETSYILYIASSGKTKWVTGSGLFGGFNSVEKIVFENVDSSAVESMASMFPGLSNLVSIEGLNKLDTSNVTSMVSMFGGCSKLTNIDLSGLGGSNLTTVQYMFSGCNNLTNINMSNFNFGTITSLYQNNKGLFQGLTTLTNVNLSGTKMDNVDSLQNLFYDCSSLTNIDLSGCGGNNLSLISSMFSKCTNLREINMSRFNFGTTTSLSGLFQNISNLTLVNLSGVQMDNVTSMQNLFSGDTSLTSIDLSGLGSNNLTTVSNMFSGCTNLREINMFNFNFGLTESLASQFRYLSNLITVNLSNSNASNVTDMSSMFEGCTSLISINLSGISTSNVKNMATMFYNCLNLVTIDLSAFDTRNVTNMDSMFEKSGLIEINLSFLNTDSIVDMYSMFRYCTKLKKINLSGLGGNNLTSTGDIFYGCTLLEEINISNFNFGQMSSLGNNFLFRGLTNLKSVDLSNIIIENVTILSGMFSGCTNLKTIYVSNTWNTSNVVSSDAMFSDCTSLVGGNGTTYDSTKTDVAMAVIDTPSTPGYLTLKSA